MTDEQPGAQRRRHSWLRILVVAFLALSGVTSILYAGLLPLRPFSDVPVPIVLQAFGVAELVAAVGIWFRRAWGRWLGVAVVALAMALSVAGASFAVVAGSNPLLELMGLGITVGIDLLILWWLLRHWQTSSETLP